MSTDKKKKEKEILFKIYIKQCNNVIDECEQPDFILEDFYKKIQFGVEVTELYLTESSARLKNIPHYPSEVIDQGKIRHKEDRNLKVEEISFFNSDGSLKIKTKGIIQLRPVISEYLKMVLDRIKNKEEKKPDYNNDLKYVNLIISDQENYFDTFDKDSFYSTFYSKEITERLLSTTFKEIFYISKFRDNNFYYYPLKSVLFHARHCLFSEFYPFKEFDLKIYLKDYIFCLLREGFNDIFIHETERFIALSYGNFVIKINPHSQSESFCAYLPDIYYYDGVKAETFLREYANEKLYKEFSDYLAEITLTKFSIGALVKEILPGSSISH